MVNANDDEMRWKTFGEARMFLSDILLQFVIQAHNHGDLSRTQRKKYMVNGLL